MNSKSTKRALLSSAFAMLVCVAMLIGTTFAWFTDTASTGVNKIQAGKLKISLIDGDENDLTGKSIRWTRKAASGRGTETIDENGLPLWEPGATYRTEWFYIRNDGNLALKYKVKINGFTGDTKLLEALDFKVLLSGANVSTSDEILNSLDELAAYEGYLYTAAEKTDSTDPSYVGIKITATMKKEAGNEYQGLCLDGIGITVVATQYTRERDSISDQYDANARYPDTWDGSINEDVSFTDGTATVSTAADFAGAAKKATENKNGDIQINLENSLVMNAANWEPIKVDGYHGAGILTIDGKGNTISGLNAPLVLGGFAGNSGIVIKNLTIADSDISVSGTSGVGAFIANVDSMTTITLENCRLVNSKVSGERVGGLIGWTSGYNNQNDGPVDTTVTVNNCSVVDSTVNATKSAGAIIGHAGANPATYHFIKNCKVENVILNGEYTGLLIGTANVGQVTADNNVLFGNVANFVGRYALGDKGKVTINGKQYTHE